MVNWTIKASAFANCNCAYGCPCQFNALPTHGNCETIICFDIEEGYHGGTRLDGLRAVAVFAWPRAIHEGNGEAQLIVDERATPKQREALPRILTGQDTAPGATLCQDLSTTLTKIHDPISAHIDFMVDIERRTARVLVPGLIVSRGEPIRNPVTGAEHRARIELPHGFSYIIAEMGRGWSRSTGAIKLEMSDSYGQFNNLHLCQDGVVR